MTPLPGATREAHSAARRDAHRRMQSLPGTIAILLLSVGLMVAASYPTLTLAAAFGALTASLARRVSRGFDGWPLSLASSRRSRTPGGEGGTARPR